MRARRLWAIVLVTLSALPFTAPFAVLGPAAPPVSVALDEAITPAQPVLLRCKVDAPDGHQLAASERLSSCKGLLAFAYRLSPPKTSPFRAGATPSVVSSSLASSQSILRI